MGPRGFLGAYFVAVDDSHGISIEVFETEELARATRLPKVPRHRGDGGHHPVRRGHRFGLTSCGREWHARNRTLTPNCPTVLMR